MSIAPGLVQPLEVHMCILAAICREQPAYHARAFATRARLRLYPPLRVKLHPAQSREAQERAAFQA